MKHMPQWFILTSVGFVSFLFFFYMSFPFEIMKETITAEISKNSGLEVTVDDLTPLIPLGVRLNGVTIKGSEGQTVSLAQVDTRVSLWKVFFGKLSANVRLTDRKSGFFNLETEFGLFSLSSGIPSYLSLEAKQFSLDDLVNFALKTVAAGPGVNIMVKPLLESFGLEGKLQGNLELNLNEKDPGKSSGNGKISLVETTLINHDPGMPIPNQKFEKALIQIDLKEGRMQLSPESGFFSQDLGLSLGGQITQRPDINFDLLLGLELKNKLGEQFGWLLGGSKNSGKVEFHVGGNLKDGPSFKSL